MPDIGRLNHTAPLRIGIVGAGGMARQRAFAFQKLPDVRISGISSNSQERLQALCAETGANAFLDSDEMLPFVDAIVLCVPNNLHAELAGKALAAGKHVLVEYPLALTLNDAEMLERAAKTSKCVLLVGNTIIHETPFKRIQTDISRMGPIVSAASCVALHDSKLADTWFMNPRLSGPCFIAFHYHHIEFYRRVLGEITWIHAIDEGRPDPTDGDFLSLAGGTVVMGHQGGATSTIQWYLSTAGHGLVRDMRLTGINASFRVSSNFEDISHASWHCNGRRGAEHFQNDWGVKGSCKDFVAAIAERFDHTERLASDITTLRTAAAAFESSTSGGVVTGPFVSDEARFRSLGT